MRIAIIGSRGIPAHYGGFETFAQELAPRLVELGHEVTVYCRKGYTGDPPPREYRGVRLVHTPCLRIRALETLSHELTAVADALRRGFDLYYFLGTRGSPLYVMPRVARRGVIVHTDGIEWKRRKWGPVARAYLRAAERFATRVADVLVADSEAMRRHHLGLYGTDSTCILYGTRIVGGPPESDVLDRFGLRTGGYYLVLCRLEPENNLDLIVREFVSSGSSAELILVGDANYETPYHRRLGELAVGRKVRFLGSVYEPRALDAIRSGARGYIHGHEVGGANPSLIEAMGAGCCALVLDTEFNREVTAGTALTWEKAQGSLSTLVHWVDERPDEARETGREARDRVTACNSWDRAAEEHDRLFRGEIVRPPPALGAHG